jgi:hypothetical protein
MPSLLVVAGKSGGAKAVTCATGTFESHSGFGLATGTPTPLATGLPGYS